MKKYFVEIYDDMEDTTILQSKPTRSKEKALKFFEDIFFIEVNMKAMLLSGDFDKDGNLNDCDIIVEENLN